MVTAANVTAADGAAVRQTAVNGTDLQEEEVAEKSDGVTEKPKSENNEGAAATGASIVAGATVKANGVATKKSSEEDGKSSEETGTKKTVEEGESD